MRQVTLGVTAVTLGTVLVLRMPLAADSGAPSTRSGAAPQAAATQKIDLAEQLKAGKLRAVNREATFEALLLKRYS